MKGLLDLKPKYTPVKKWKRKPNKKNKPLPDIKPFYENICRVLPAYVAENFKYYEQFPEPSRIPKDLETYVKRIKIKINEMKI